MSIACDKYRVWNIFIHKLVILQQPVVLDRLFFCKSLDCPPGYFGILLLEQQQLFIIRRKLYPGAFQHGSPQIIGAHIAIFRIIPIII